jgi:hypothetical protein
MTSCQRAGSLLAEAGSSPARRERARGRARLCSSGGAVQRSVIRETGWPGCRTRFRRAVEGRIGRASTDDARGAPSSRGRAVYCERANGTSVSGAQCSLGLEGTAGVEASEPGRSAHRPHWPRIAPHLERYRGCVQLGASYRTNCRRRARYGLPFKMGGQRSWQVGGSGPGAGRPECMTTRNRPGRLPDDRARCRHRLRAGRPGF